MRYTIDPGRKENTITVIDNIVFSRVKDTEGNDMELKLSVTADFGNSEMMALRTGKIPTEGAKMRPCMIWFNGSGWRGAEKNMQLADLVYLAKAGYALVCADYRSSAKGHFPDQIIDAKTAVRFMRANASRYGIDPDRIGVFGRSAGGQIACLVGLNDGKYISDEYADVPSDVQAVYDMFGPNDLYGAAKEHMQMEEDGTLEKNTGRWKTIWDCHEGAVLGGERETLLERAKEFSPVYHVTGKNAPTLIMHGDADPLVPMKRSEEYYDILCENGVEADLYIVKNGGHGSPEFFQEETKQVVLQWLKEHL